MRHNSVLAAIILGVAILGAAWIIHSDLKSLRLQIAGIHIPEFPGTVNVQSFGSLKVQGTQDVNSAPIRMRMAPDKNP